eukprot:CAMPEP_0172616690 /NCGR_PEP_ID=MMETSP1068-20121228/66723_1 /TAXON_ID=35684 /ORGANISM="Pseudopedinella elastica, Strain CCMP716" /LENGTH=168 /DNA_ID=CAMNT_0013422203 /DNA_START=72 /DNA_END=578 /DNA_ORIENTATION=+
MLRVAVLVLAQSVQAFVPSKLRPARALVTRHGRKPGVSDPNDLAAFVASAGSNLVVVDARNLDFEKEPGDEKAHELAPIATPPADTSYRPRAVNVPYQRDSESMDLSLIPAEWVEAAGGLENMPVITHCGGGGRGQKAKDYLLANGFKNVLNGGGPADAECWAKFGDK